MAGAWQLDHAASSAESDSWQFKASEDSRSAPAKLDLRITRFLWRSIGPLLASKKMVHNLECTTMRCLCCTAPCEQTQSDGVAASPVKCAASSQARAGAVTFKSWRSRREGRSGGDGSSHGGSSEKINQPSQEIIIYISSTISPSVHEALPAEATAQTNATGQLQICSQTVGRSILRWSPCIECVPACQYWLARRALH